MPLLAIRTSRVRPMASMRPVAVRPLVLALAGGLVLMGTPACVTDPYTGERRIAKTVWGGAIGGAAGAGTPTAPNHNPPV